MATTTLTTVDNILKEVYNDGGVEDQLQSEVTALKRIERSSEGVEHRVGGKYVRFPVRYKRNHGIGARSENEALPIPRTPGFEDATVTLKYLYGALELTGQTLELADKNFQAFASTLETEMSDLKEGLRKDQARQTYGDSVGKLATATGAGSTTTFVTTNAQYLEIGMFVDIYQSGGSSRVADVEITGISESAGTSTVTVSPAAGTTITTGDYMVRDNSLNKEMNGFGSIVKASGSLYGIDPSSIGVWKSTVLDNSATNRALTEGLMITLVDTIRRAGGGVPTVAFTSLGVRRSYFNLLSQQRRSTNTQEFEGGFKGLGFTMGVNEIPIMEDVDAPPNKMYFVNEKKIKLYEAGPWSFMDRDGSKWQRVVNSSGTFDAYTAIMYKYCEMGTERRNAHGLLSDLIEG